jgi:hypothetical protein
VSFYRNTLKGQYLGDDSGSMTVAGSGGCLAGLASFSIDPANG